MIAFFLIREWSMVNCEYSRIRQLAEQATRQMQNASIRNKT